MIAITPIKAFTDNYIWLISQGQQAIVIDPGDADAVIHHLEKNQLTLSAILITHHHADHTGGLLTLKARFNCPVFGPNNRQIQGVDNICAQGDEFQVDAFQLLIKVIEVPGHTLDHIAFYVMNNKTKQPHLFCGDTLFSGGCGRIFEGSAEQMWRSISKLINLPKNTLLYPAHEYTLSNLKFALSVEPENMALKRYRNKVIELRELQQPSLPTLLSLELQINPFLRVAQPSIVAAVQQSTKTNHLADHLVFATIRQWKDSF